MDSRYQLFLQAVRAQSFTRAAEKMGYTQSAVSQAVRSLENELGTVLITRSHDGISLTRDGEAYLPYVEAIVAGENALRAKRREMQGLTKSLIRVGTFTSVSRNLLPALIQSFLKDYPDVRFELRQGEYTSINADILNGRLDFGFVSPEFVSGLETEVICTDTMMAVLPLSSPLAAQRTISLRQLAVFPYILLDEGEYSVALEAFAGIGLEPDVRFKVTDDYSILAMVRQNMGYSLVYRLMLAGFSDGVAVIPVQEPVQRTIAMGWHNYETLPLAAKRFIGHIRAHAPELLSHLEK
jgi:DNA-binding transcriptional LysR family regulator